MFLSCLLIDTGTNPDRPRPGRMWLRNLYHVHQRLCMAFPSTRRRERDPGFLAPYSPGDFPEQRHLADKKKSEVDAVVLKHVHSQRNADAGFLFRIDPGPDGRAVILVQSAVKPDWDYAFQNARFLQAAPAEVKVYEPTFAAGQRLRFRLLANPTKKIDTLRQADRQRHTKEELRQIEGRNGRRVPVPSAEELRAWRQKNPNEDERTFICLRLLEWLEQKAEPAGFSLENVSVQPGYNYFKKPAQHERQGPERQTKDTGRRRSARYDGVLVVADAARFRETLVGGIGSGKAFGFGLLSVAPCRESQGPAGRPAS